MTGDRRDLFDIPGDVAYFNAAYMGPSPRVVEEAAIAAARRRAMPWTVDTPDFFTESETARALAARLFGADAESIAIVPSASYGLAVAARNIALEAGQDILLLDDQFPSNVYTWRKLAKTSGAAVRTLTRRDGQSWTEALLAAIGPQTGLVACAQVHWIDGGRIDLEAVAAAAREHGAKVVLDLTQSLGVLPFDAAVVRPDFAIAACYKWLLGPYALGFLYAAPHHHEGVALEENWIARQGSQDFAGLVAYRDEYQPGARRFDMGERANFQQLPPAIAALELLLELNPDNTSHALGARTAQIAERLTPLGFQAESQNMRAPHYLALSAPSDAPADLAQRLRVDNVFVSQRGARLRVTPHVHVNDADVDRLADALARLLS